jgi:hypothetical protein
MKKKSFVENKNGLSFDGRQGGVFKGDRHSAPSGGIAVSVEGGGNVLVEDSEPIIVPEAVNSNTLVSFDGKKMKPKEVISLINQNYGGVPIKKKGGFVDAKAEIKRLRDIKEKKERGGNIEQPIKVQAGSVVVTRNAVLDEKTKHEYNGEMLTNKEILSKINHDIGGGVEFAEGGKIELDVKRTAKSVSKRVAVEHAGYEGAKRVTGANENKLELDGYGTVLTSQFINTLVKNGRLPKQALKNRHIQLTDEYATKLLNENSDLFPKEQIIYEIYSIFLLYSLGHLQRQDYQSTLT